MAKNILILLLCLALAGTGLLAWQNQKQLDAADAAAALKDHSDALEQELADKQARLTTLESAWAERLSTLQAERNQSLDRMDTLAADLRRADQRRREWENRYEEADSDRELLQAKVLSLQDRLLTQRAQVETLSTELKVLRTQYAEARERLQALTGGETGPVAGR